MTEDVIKGALIAAQEYIRRCANPEVTYGYFHGGDPRDFHPDGEVCTPAELEAHRVACEAWNRGERPECEAHHHKVVEYDGKTAVASYAGAFGMGTYSRARVMRDEDAEDVLDQVDAALAALER